MKQSIYLLSVSVFSLVLTSCIEQVAIDPVPTKPTTTTFYDGFVTRDTVITLNIGGSTVNDDASIVYEYYFSSDGSDFEVINPENVRLKPYTQYWWYVVPISHFKDELLAEGEKSDTRKLYCVPPFPIETDNGDGEWAAFLDFKKVKNVVGGKVTAISDKYEYEIELSEGQDKCKLEGKNVNSPENNAYKHWWDDANGVEYEPIIYTFKVDLDLKVGDTIVTCTNYAKEIILDKSSLVRDHEFNVYRVVKIGNRQWLADDLRTKSFIYKGDTIKLDDIVFNDVYNGKQPAPYKTIELPESGSKGITYCVGDYWGEFVWINGRYEELRAQELISLLAPKGYHISNNADWEDLERYYGVESPNIPEKVGYNGSTYFPQGYVSVGSFDNIRENYSQYFQGGDVELRRRLSSNTDWIYYDPDETPNPDYIQMSVFNAKPFAGRGYGCIYYTLMNEEDKQKNPDIIFLFRILSTVDKGILNLGDEVWWQGNHSRYASLRCVKD